MKLFRVSIDGLHDNIYVVVRCNTKVYPGDKVLVVPCTSHNPVVGELQERADTKNKTPGIYGIVVMKISKPKEIPFDLEDKVKEFTAKVDEVRELYNKLVVCPNIRVLNTNSLPKIELIPVRKVDYVISCRKLSPTKTSSITYDISVCSDDEITKGDILVVNGETYLYDEDEPDSDILVANTDYILVKSNTIDVQKKLGADLVSLSYRLTNEFYKIFE